MKENENIENSNEIINPENIEELESESKTQGEKEKEKLPMIDSDSQEIPNTQTPPINIRRNNRRKSTFVDIEKAKKEADSLLQGDEPQGAKANLLFEEKSITIFRLYGHLNRPIDYFFMILALIGSIGSGISIPIQVYISSDLFSEVGNTSESYTPEDIIIMMEIVENTFNKQIKRFFIFGTIAFFCNFLSMSFWNLLGQRDIHHLKFKYFSIILGQEQGWFDKNNAYEFATKVQAQLEQVEMGIGDKLGNIFVSIAQCVTGFVIAFITSWKLTLVMLSIAPLILATVCFMLVSMKTGIIMSRKIYEKAGGIAEEMLYNIKTVASFANFEFEKSRFNEKIEICYQIELKTIRKLGFCIGFMMFFLNCTMFISLLYGRTLIQKDINSNKGRSFTGGDVITVTFCTLMGVMGIGMIAPNIKIVQESCTASSDYFTLYEREIPMDFSKSTEKPDLDKIKGHIVFKDVLFRYPNDENKRIILNRLNLEIEPGKKVALVGESGCGKSTTVNLIERLYESSEGEILIDDIEIKRYNIQYLRSLIGYVPQEPVLFNKSIRENIIFGREELIKKFGNIDDLIQKACDESYATEFINNLPGGLDYVVGIKGSKLSGGQKQIIAIARAILANPKILILDEATSALDNKSEKEVQRALDNISQKNVTTIIIAHRLSTIKNADMIFAIKDGKVLEKGTHKELLEKNGYYAGLVKSQLAQDEIETKEQRELTKKRSSLKRQNTDDEVHFEKKEEEIMIDQDTVSIRPSRLFGEIHDKKLNMFFACLGAAIVGGLTPANGVMMGNAMNGLNSRFETIRYDKGLKYALLFLLVAFLQGLGNTLMNWQFMVLGASLVRAYRKKILSKYLQVHLSFFDLTINSPGSLLTKLSIDTTQLNALLLTILGSTVQCSVVLVVGITLGCIYEYRLTLILFCFIPFIVASMIIRRILNRGSSRRGVKVNIEAGGVLLECVTNTKTIYSFNFQKKAVQMYMEIIDFLRNQFVRDSMIGGFFIGLGQFCMFAANATVLYAAKKYILKGEIDSEDMALVMNVVMTAASGIGQGIGNIGDIKKANIAFKSIYSTLDIQSKISAFREDNEGKKSPENLKGRIEFKNVYFAYPTRPEQIILKDLSFIIEPGQQAALVGYSGSGKSTVIQLLERFYDVEEGKGEILIDGINIKDYNLYELRKKIGLVSQEPVLFKRSMLENVRYGKLDSTVEDCVNAAKEANIMKFFSDDKMNQEIGGETTAKKKNKEKHRKSDVGKKEDPVSGGEKQRLAIARAFLKNPVILLLDEATSALDKDSELEVQKSLDRLSKNRTSIAIAHRLSTIEKCDKIFVLENGRLVEQGTHQELMALKNKYYTLYKYSDTA